MIVIKVGVIASSTKKSTVDPLLVYRHRQGWQAALRLVWPPNPYRDPLYCCLANAGERLLHCASPRADARPSRPSTVRKPRAIEQQNLGDRLTQTACDSLSVLAALLRGPPPQSPLYSKHGNHLLHGSMARQLFLIALVVCMLLTCLQAQSSLNSETSPEPDVLPTVEKAGLGPLDDGRVDQAVRPEMEACPSVEDGEAHADLRRRCVSKSRKWSWTRGSRNSKAKEEGIS